MYRVIATDLDGTLLDSRQGLHPRTIAALNTLHDRGIHIVIATGRHYKEAREIRRRLGIDVHFITANGARTHTPDGVCLERKNLDAQLVRSLLAVPVPADVFVSLYTDDSWLCQAAPDWVERYDCGAGFMPLEQDLSRFNGEGVAKMHFMGSPADLAIAESGLRDACPGDIDLTYSLPECLELMAPGVSKGPALASVLQRLGIEPERCVAFGDGMNDVSLLQGIGHPCVMGNAHPRMLAMFPYAMRIGSNDDAGVAARLEKMFDL